MGFDRNPPVNNGASAIFPDKLNVLSESTKSMLLTRIRSRFPSERHIVIHLTNTCTTCSLGPQLEEVGKEKSQIQMMYMQDYLPPLFPKEKKIFVISDPECKLIGRQEASKMPVTLCLETDKHHREHLTEVHQSNLWKKVL